MSDLFHKKRARGGVIKAGAKPSKRARRVVVRAPFPSDPGLMVTLDPGFNNPAAALWSPQGQLLEASRVKTHSSWVSLENGPRAKLVAVAIAEWIAAALDRHGFTVPIDTVAFEWPQVYRETKAGGKNPNNLLQIHAVASIVIGILVAVNENLVVIDRTPHEFWAGLEKTTEGDPWTSVRGMRVAARLRPDERRATESTHDAIDAVGMGLVVLGRFDRVRVFHGAT